jgi:hypothetical protein
MMRSPTVDRLPREVRLSESATEVVYNAAKYARSGVLDADTLLRSAVDYGRGNERSSARALFDIISDQVGIDQLSSLLYEPESSPIQELGSIQISRGVVEGAEKGSVIKS